MHSKSQIANRNQIHNVFKGRSITLSWGDFVPGKNPNRRKRRVTVTQTINTSKGPITRTVTRRGQIVRGDVVKILPSPFDTLAQTPLAKTDIPENPVESLAITSISARDIAQTFEKQRIYRLKLKLREVRKILGERGNQNLKLFAKKLGVPVTTMFYSAFSDRSGLEKMLKFWGVQNFISGMVGIASRQELAEFHENIRLSPRNVDLNGYIYFPALKECGSHSVANLIKYAGSIRASRFFLEVKEPKKYLDALGAQTVGEVLKREQSAQGEGLGNVVNILQLLIKRKKGQ